MATLGTVGVLYIVYGVGLLSLLVSTYRGIAKAFKPWSERQCRASRFLFVFMSVIEKHTVAVVLDRNIG